MATYATVDDVAARYEGSIEQRQAWVSTLLNDAEALVREHVPALDARVADGRTSAETVKRVLCTMVLDVIRNPSGYSSQTAGEFSYSFQGAGGSVVGGHMRLSSDDKRALVGRSRARTVALDDPALSRPLRWTVPRRPHPDWT